MHGLTHQGSLAQFWSNSAKPDAELFNSFRRVLLHVNHINGDYFTRKGIALAVANAWKFLGPISPLDELRAQVASRKPPAEDPVRTGDATVPCS
jgi:hypothetical protein